MVTGQIDTCINDGLVLEMIVEKMVGGWVDLYGKSGPFCPGSPISYSLLSIPRSQCHLCTSLIKVRVTMSTTDIILRR